LGITFLVNAQEARHKGGELNGHPAAFAAGLGLLIAGLISAVDDVLGLFAVLTAACAGLARYTAVLLRLEQPVIERATARGFFAGVLLSAALLIFDRF
jgi:hypothetical protein